MSAERVLSGLLLVAGAVLTVAGLWWVHPGLVMALAGLLAVALGVFLTPTERPGGSSKPKQD
jgi:hypothetical protein